MKKICIGRTSENSDDQYVVVGISERYEQLKTQHGDKALALLRVALRSATYADCINTLEVIEHIEQLIVHRETNRAMDYDPPEENIFEYWLRGQDSWKQYEAPEGEIFDVPDM